MSDPNRKIIYLDDALKALRPIMRKSDYFYEIQKAIQDVPSAQPQACDDAISRKDAIDYLTIKANMTGSYGYLGTKEIHDYLSCMSSVQPERKTGKWISTDDGWDGGYFVCSVCGCPWTLIEGSPEDNGMNFCPNCGAYMGGEHDERTD